MTRDKLGIVPHLKFAFDARITRIRVRLLPDKYRYDYPYMQVWRPSSKDSTIYTKIAQVQVKLRHIKRLKYVEADIPLTGVNRIPVQLGDVVGYYHPFDAGFKVRTVETAGYVLYILDNIDGSTATSIDLKNARHSVGLRQPLIKFTVGKLNELLTLEVLNFCKLFNLNVISETSTICIILIFILL